MYKKEDEEKMWKEMNDSIDEHCIHFKGIVDNKECDKRKFLKILACPICSYVFSLRHLSGNKDMYSNMKGIYQMDQELEKYIEDNREHIVKHNLIGI